MQSVENDERQERQLMSELVDETEREMFRYGSAKSEEDAQAMEPEDNGNRDLEEREEDIFGDTPEEVEEADRQAAGEDDEPQDGGEDEEEQVPDDEEPQYSDRPQRDEREARSVPSYRLREQSERVEALQREIADLRMRVQSPQQAPQPQQSPQKPDMFVDPDGHAAWQMQQTLQAVRMQEAERSMQAAAEEYGDDFQYAYQVLQNGVRANDPRAHQTVQSIIASGNPGRALMRWAEPLLQDRADQQEEMHRQWYRDTYGREAPEPRQMRSGQGEFRQSVPPRRGMPSLNGAGGNGRVMNRPRQNAGTDDTDEGIFNYAFDDIRR